MRQICTSGFIALGITAWLMGGTAAAETFDLPDAVRYSRFEWMGPAGHPLPLTTEGELLDFLREAPVVASKRLGTGINRPLKVTLERNGVRAHAIFRTVDHKRHGSPTGAAHKIFRDSYVFEVAAYRLSRLLGLDSIPPTVLRELDGEPGSIQLWVEEATTENQRRQTGSTPTDMGFWYRQSQTMALFDNLIYNFDRNGGNILYDESGKVWMVDHTRSFKTQGVLNAPDKINRVDRRLWQALLELDEGEVRQTLRPYLDTFAIKAMLDRRKRIVRRVERLIQLRGEEGVLFDLEHV